MPRDSPLAFLAVRRDVTERKQMEQQLDEYTR